MDYNPLPGDVALLVPVERQWRVLDLTRGAGERATVIAPWVRHAVYVLPDIGARPGRVERAGVAGAGGSSVLDAVVAGGALPFRRGAFDLVLLEQSSPWSLQDGRALLRVGGWLILIVDGLPRPSLRWRGLRTSGGAVRSLREWIEARLSLEADWRRTLAAHHLTYRRAYVHFQEYAWGYLPFDAPAVQRYYLDAIQEEGTGVARGRARVARLLGRVGLYRYLASTYVVVARAGVGIDE